MHSILVLLSQGMFYCAEAKQNRLSYSLQSFGMHFIWWLFWQWHQDLSHQSTPIVLKIKHIAANYATGLTTQHRKKQYGPIRPHTDPGKALHAAQSTKGLRMIKEKEKGFPGSPFIIWDLTDLLPNSLWKSREQKEGIWGQSGVKNVKITSNLGIGADIGLFIFEWITKQEQSKTEQMVFFHSSTHPVFQ